ncbi:hypothetical protein NE686_17700 [Tissierella carlieri]|uniref:Uncharacterized protein n=1 Tax=Tissierella carlieri TaxID=689904 RepID=A0ABT1SEM6_9FIRM|nr:hypothetical protein [Tissierella carlieri]MCQ4924939.1 hypothetical protein [Tissierella carlieri]
MSDVKSLVSEVKIKDFEDKVQVYLVNNSYFSVVYGEKEEYYTKNKKLASIVGAIILTFYKNLNLGASIFNQSISEEESLEEERWSKLLEFLKEESKKNGVDWEISLGVYRSLEDSYNDAISKEIQEKELLSKRTSIRSKDNLVTTVVKITSLFNKEEAEKNLGRYKKVRNEYIKANPQLNLSLL